MNDNERQIEFGDNVRVRVTPFTEEKGLAGLQGQVYGETTPSVTNVEVIGTLTNDYAINAHFDEKDGTFWFAPDQLEFVDHGPGTEIAVGNKRIVRREDGSWAESTIETRKSPWWKFWQTIISSKRNLLPPIIAHGMNDTLNFILFYSGLIER